MKTIAIIVALLWTSQIQAQIDIGVNSSGGETPSGENLYLVTGTVCDASMESPSILNQVKYSDNHVRFLLGSEHYGANYSATICLQADKLSEEDMTDPVINIRLSSSNIVGAARSYLALARPQLTVKAGCDGASHTLYNGLFVGSLLSFAIPGQFGVKCEVSVRWIEPAGGERDYLERASRVTMSIKVNSELTGGESPPS
jgi:hypothetical protein